MVYLGNRPPTLRLEHCVRCDTFIEAGTECPCVADRDLFSDLYKAEMGFRPRWELAHWSIAQIRAWLAAH